MPTQGHLIHGAKPDSLSFLYCFGSVYLLSELWALHLDWVPCRAWSLLRGPLWWGCVKSAPEKALKSKGTLACPILEGRGWVLP